MAQFSPAVMAARARRAARSAQGQVEVQWFINEVVNRVDLTMRQRVTIVTHMVRDRVVKNISVPVTKEVIKGRTVVTERSKPGEFPRADTTLLMKTIFTDIKEIEPHVMEGYVGTPLDYGVELELRKNRSFLRRTLMEFQSDAVRILTGPIT